MPLLALGRWGSWLGVCFTHFPSGVSPRSFPAVFRWSLQCFREFSFLPFSLLFLEGNFGCSGGFLCSQISPFFCPWQFSSFPVPFLFTLFGWFGLVSVSSSCFLELEAEVLFLERLSPCGLVSSLSLHFFLFPPCLVGLCTFLLEDCLVL